ncbi:MAG: hypothetical protein GX100_07560 [candidate division WS1 bacterium]|nr:hypothetical protein [candidate division WS1 bacterium]
MNKSVRIAGTATVLVAMLVLLVLPAFAQAPREGRAGQRAAGTRGGMIAGTIAEVDPATNSVRVNLGDNQEVWVSITPRTQMGRWVEAAAAELEVGQPVTLIAQATAVTATSLVIGEQGPGLQQRIGRPQAGGDLPAPGAAGAAPGAAPAAPAAGEQPGRPSPLTIRLSAKVETLDPLTVALEDGTSLPVTLTEDTKLAEIQPVTIDQLKAGELILATGQRQQDGAVAAVMVRIGQTLEQFRQTAGFGAMGAAGAGFGGRPRGGGAPGGAPGGPPAPPQ